MPMIAVVDKFLQKLFFDDFLFPLVLTVPTSFGYFQATHNSIIHNLFVATLLCNQLPLIKGWLD